MKASRRGRDARPTDPGKDCLEPDFRLRIRAAIREIGIAIINVVPLSFPTGTVVAILRRSPSRAETCLTVPGINHLIARFPVENVRGRARRRNSSIAVLGTLTGVLGALFRQSVDGNEFVPRHDIAGFGYSPGEQTLLANDYDKITVEPGFARKL